MDRGYCVSYIVLFVEQQSWVQNQLIGIDRDMKSDKNVHFQKMIGIIITFV